MKNRVSVTQFASTNKIFHLISTTFYNFFFWYRPFNDFFECTIKSKFAILDCIALCKTSTSSKNCCLPFSKSNEKRNCLLCSLSSFRFFSNFDGFFVKNKFPGTFWPFEAFLLIQCCVSVKRSLLNITNLWTLKFKLINSLVFFSFEFRWHLEILLQRQLCFFPKIL